MTCFKFEQELNPVISLVSLKPEDYLIIGGAAESMIGFVSCFNDIDIIVSPETFKKLIDLEYVVTNINKPIANRSITIGNVDIIEHLGDWIDENNKQMIGKYPVLKFHKMIEIRIAMGRDKDRLRAWELIHFGRENNLVGNVYIKIVSDLLLTVHKKVCSKMTCM